MTPQEVEEGFLDLLGRLSGYGKIIRRSISRNVPVTLFLLYMNWSFRREFVRLRRKRAELAMRPDPSSLMQPS
jgi:hypothetical protein